MIKLPVPRDRSRLKDIARKILSSQDTPPTIKLSTRVILLTRDVARFVTVRSTEEGGDRIVLRGGKFQGDFFSGPRELYRSYLTGLTS